MRIVFPVPGKPYAKKRPRFSRRIGRAFDPHENAVAEASIGHIAARYFDTPLTGPVRLEVEAVFVPPASWSKKRRAMAIGEPHTQKPDGDNLLKAAKDALNRIAWADDAQVHDARIVKRWGAESQTIITIEAAG